MSRVWIDPSGCRFGYVEYDGDQYCFEHGGFRCHVVGGPCSKHPEALDGDS